MVIDSSVRSDGTIVEVVRRVSGTFFVRTTDGITGHVKTQNVSEQQVWAMGLGEKIPPRAR